MTTVQNNQKVHTVVKQQKKLNFNQESVFFIGAY